MITDNKLGCYGMAIAFNTESKTCIECPDNRSCALRSRDSLLEIHQQTDVSDYLEALKRSGLDIEITDSPNLFPRQHSGKVKAKRGKIPTVKLDLLTDMTKGGRLVAERMLKAEPDIESAIQKGINPFYGVKPSYIAAVFNLALQRPFTKQDVKATLLEVNPAWSEGSIRSHYNSITNALVGLNVIKPLDDEYFALRGKHEDY